jgi:hypothetical protein
MEEIKLFDTDFVIWDKANDNLIRWESNGDIVIFGDKYEAENDCYGNESVVSCTDLPQHHQEELLNQIKRNLN